MDTFTFVDPNKRNDLSFLGFSGYSIDVYGNCIHDRYCSPPEINKNGRIVLWRDTANGRVVKTYRLEDLVVASWSGLDKMWWSHSPFADRIEAFKVGFRDLPAKDKVKLPYTSRDGNGYWLTREGRIWREADMREMAYPVNSSGYVNLRLGEAENVRLHRLTAHYFVPIPEELRQAGFDETNLVVNHKDGNKTNNNADNLEWVLGKENTAHASRNLLMKTTISQATLETIWRLLQDGKTNVEISAITGVPSSTISNIRNGVSPRYRTDKYHWKSAEELRREEHMKILEAYNSGKKFKDICTEFGTSESHINGILKKYPELITREAAAKRPQDKLPDGVLQKIFRMLVEHKSVSEIAAATGTSSDKISKIKHRQLYRSQGLAYVWEEDGKIDEAILAEDAKQTFINEKNLRLKKKVFEAYSRGIRTAGAIAKEIGINAHQVEGIARRMGIKLDEVTASLFTREELEGIFTMLKEGATDNEIAEHYYVDPQRISGIRGRRIYAKESQGWEWPNVSSRTFSAY